MEFGSLFGFIEHSENVNTSKCSAIYNSHFPQSTKVRTKYPKSALSSLMSSASVLTLTTNFLHFCHFKTQLTTKTRILLQSQMLLVTQPQHGSHRKHSSSAAVRCCLVGLSGITIFLLKFAGHNGRCLVVCITIIT
jgi:hypothetical protein